MRDGRERRESPPPNFGHTASTGGRPSQDRRPQDRRPDQGRPQSRRARRAAAAAQRRGRRRALRFTALGVALAAGTAASVVLAPADLARTTKATATDRLTVVPVSADTYVSREKPDSARGAHAVVTAASWPDWHTEGYLSFTVPADAPRFRSVQLELTLDRHENLPKSVELRELPNGWTEGETTWRNRPDTGRRLTDIALERPAPDGDAGPGGTDGQVAIDVSPWVTGPGKYAFALVNSEKYTAVRFRAGETAAGPRLVLSPDERAANPSPSPSGAGDASSTGRPAAPPTTRDKAPAAASPTSPSPSTEKRDGGKESGGGSDARTLCGVSLEVDKGQTHLEALVEAEKRYGRLDMVRQFYPGEPGAWPGRFGDKLEKRPTVVSFKMEPRDILAGKYDEKMTRWFAKAPSDRDVYWVYYHEPEDNIQDGHFTAADYRAAWRHLDGLADKADNSRLKATLVLMSWSLEAESHRNWRDYYPGNDVIEVLGWDTYNLAKDRYQSPDEMYSKVLEVSREEGLPFGVAETGAHLLPGDNGAKRAQWLRSMTRYLEKKDALWVAYFDLDWPSGDFRLLDGPSINAWSDFC